MKQAIAALDLTEAVKPGPGYVNSVRSTTCQLDRLDFYDLKLLPDNSSIRNLAPVRCLVKVEYYGLLAYILVYHDPIDNPVRMLVLFSLMEDRL